MRLHHRGKKADWHRVLPEKRNFWQRLAKLSAGVATPGNLISLGGLLLVLLGTWLLVQQQYVAGLSVIVVGRISDVLDGIVAEKTGTKSPLGEIVDTTVDKLAVLIIVPVLIIEHLLPLPIVYIILLQNTINVLIAAIAKVRQVELRPSIEGKISMAASWTTVVAFSVLAIAREHHQPAKVNTLVAIVAYAALATFLIYGYRASRNYARLVFNRRPVLLSELHRAIVIINPQSSNVQRIDRRSHELARLFPDTKVTLIETSARPGQLTDRLRRELNTQAGPTLLAIGGGDGTVHVIINALMELQGEGQNLADVPILPLWGGNANDLAYMLNGLPSRVTLSSILNRGRLVAVHPLKIVITEGNHKAAERYAACYASFGASAYAAAELEKPTHKNEVRSSGAFGTFMKELRQATRAMLSASGFDAEQNGERIKIFEQVFANGSRMAKLDRFPIKLHEKVFYRIVKSDRSTTVAFYLRQLIQGKKLGEVTDRTFRFTTRERAWAQFDGEATVLAANTTVSVGLAEMPFYAVSTKLEPQKKSRSFKR